jgi:hypothetical protein
MSFLMAIAMIALTIGGALSYLTERETRIWFHREVAAAPVRLTFAFAWLGVTLGFFLGVFIRPLGDINIFSLPLWQACGIGAVIGLVIEMLYQRVSRS